MPSSAPHPPPAGRVEGEGETGTIGYNDFDLFTEYVLIFVTTVHSTVDLGTTILTFFEKMKNPDPEMDAKLNSKKHL